MQVVNLPVYQGKILPPQICTLIWLQGASLVQALQAELLLQEISDVTLHSIKEILNLATILQAQIFKFEPCNMFARQSQVCKTIASSQTCD